MRGTADLQLLETPVPTLLHEVTGGLPCDRRGSFATLDKTGVRSTQRLAIGDVGGGIAVFTWPAELVQQARHLYTADRAPRLLAAAGVGGWDVDMRPHLAFWLSRPSDRLYLNPDPAIGVVEYVERWQSADHARIGTHPRETVRSSLWPWLVHRGYASEADGAELDSFLGRLDSRNRDAHLRPALRLLRRWSHKEVAELRRARALPDTIRESVNRLLTAVDDPHLRP